MRQIPRYYTTMGTLVNTQSCCNRYLKMRIKHTVSYYLTFQSIKILTIQESHLEDERISTCQEKGSDRGGELEQARSECLRKDM